MSESASNIEVRVNGRVLSVDFAYPNFGRTYISESQGANRESPTITKVTDSDGVIRYARNERGGIYAGGISREEYLAIENAIIEWGYEQTDAQIGPEPEDSSDSD